MAQIISNAVAVALALALPRLLILLKLALPHILTASPNYWASLSSRLRPINFRQRPYSTSNFHNVLGAEHGGYYLGDIDNPPPSTYHPNQSRRILSGFRRTIQESTSFEDAAVRLAIHH